MRHVKIRSLSLFRAARFALAAAVFIAAASAGAPGGEAAAKYVFLFIGDGMGAAQRNAAEIFLAGLRTEKGDGAERTAQLVMNSFPANGYIKTGSLSGVTDSAAAGTALAAGRKTVNGAVGSNPKTGENFDSIAALAKRAGFKTGIISTVFMQDATPAAFFGHAASRSERYKLGLQMAESGFDYFGGGGFIDETGKDKKSRSLYGVMAEKGYVIKKDFSAPASGGKVMAIAPKLSGGTMPWAIDGGGGPGLADFVDYGIKILDNEKGFFIMAEGGKIDLAGHANDAASAVREVVAFDDAIARAAAFAETRPDSTLIVVTSDHETGGLTFDAARANQTEFYRALAAQTGSYSAFERKSPPAAGAKFDAGLAAARAFFGPGVTASENVKKAFAFSATDKKNRPSGAAEYKKLYGPYDPFTVACMREANAAVGVTWTTFYHTGKDVPVSAMGAGAELFDGEYENTDIFTKICAAMGISAREISGAGIF
jgi:alkaline phosphatase